MTFIIDDGIATPCECRALREAEDIMKKSGIGREFRNKRFDNFDFSRSMAVMDGYRKAMNYENEFLDIENSRCNSIMFWDKLGVERPILVWLFVMSLWIEELVLFIWVIVMLLLILSKI